MTCPFCGVEMDVQADADGHDVHYCIFCDYLVRA